MKPQDFILRPRSQRIVGPPFDVIPRGDEQCKKPY